MIKTGRPHPDRANISWGPIDADASAEFPYETTIYFETSEDAGTPEHSARAACCAISASKARSRKS